MPNRIIQHEDGLRNISDLPMPSVHIFRNIDPIHQDLSLLWSEEAKQDINSCGFSSSGCTHDTNRFTLIDGHESTGGDVLFRVRVMEEYVV